MDVSSQNLTDSSVLAAAAAAELLSQFITQLKVQKYLLVLRFLIGLSILVVNGVLIAAFATSAQIRTLDNVLLIKLAIFDTLAGMSVVINAIANCFYPVINSLCLTSAWILGLSFIGIHIQPDGYHYGEIPQSLSSVHLHDEGEPEVDVGIFSV